MAGKNSPFISHHEQGSALVYILVAIALLAALTVSFMEPSGQQSQSQNTFKLTSELAAQAEFIRTAVQECVTLHGGGDSGIDPSTSGNTPGANKVFPLDPRSNHLTNPSVESNALVRELRCPGNPGDLKVPPFTPNSDHRPIFSGKSGKFMPPSPALMGEWQWYNGLDGVFFWIASSKSDAHIKTALDKLNEQYAPCEADVIEGGSTGTNLDNAASQSCPADSVCFRLWMITHDASAVSPDPFPAEQSVFSSAEAASCP